MLDDRSDYARSLYRIGATDSEIVDLLAEHDAETFAWEPADLGSRVCPACEATVLEVPSCERCGVVDDAIAF